MPTLVVAQISTNKLLQVDHAQFNEEPEQRGYVYSNYIGLDPDDVQPTIIDPSLYRWDFEAQYYLVDGVPTVRPEMTCTIDKTQVSADGVDFCTIVGEPDHAAVLIDGVTVAATDSTGVELTFDTTGQYVVDIVLEPYITWTVTIDAS